MNPTIFQALPVTSFATPASIATPTGAGRWSYIAVDEGNGNVYAIDRVLNDIHLQTGGVGAFVRLNQTARSYVGLAINQTNHDVYTAVYSSSAGTGGDIYVRAGGTGNFTAIGGTNRYWSSLAIDQVSGDVYAGMTLGGLYKRTAGAGVFVDTGITGMFRALAYMASTGDLFATLGNASGLWKKGPADAGFTLYHSGNWNALALNQTTGEIYIADYAGGDIYRQSGIGADFYPLGLGNMNANSLAVNSVTGDMHATAGELGVFLIAVGNVGHDPATHPDVWQAISNTNAWKMFNPQPSEQTERLGSIMVGLAPGAIDTLGLINISATTLLVQMWNGSTLVYDSTVDVSAKTDYAVTGLPQYDGCYLEVSLSGAVDDLIKCGVFIVGIAVDIGGTRYGCQVGVKDYSKKTRDTFGRFELLERTYAKIISAQTNMPPYPASIQRLLADVRATPTLWHDDSGYEVLTAFGFYNRFSITRLDDGVNQCAIEIESLGN